MSDSVSADYWKECDTCSEKVAYHNAVKHQSHSVAFCSQSCLNQWQNKMEATRL